MKVVISSDYCYGIWLQLRSLGINDVLDLSAQYHFSSSKMVNFHKSIVCCRTMLTNQKDLKLAYDSLADKESREIFRTILTYWQNPDPKIITRFSDSERYYFP